MRSTYEPHHTYLTLLIIHNNRRIHLYIFQQFLIVENYNKHFIVMNVNYELSFEVV